MPERKRRLDRMDASDVSETLRSRGWQLIAERVNRVRAQKIEELLKAQPETGTATIRGFVAGLDCVLAIPEILQAEARPGGEGD